MSSSARHGTIYHQNTTTWNSTVNVYLNIAPNWTQNIGRRAARTTLLFIYFFLLTTEDVQYFGFVERDDASTALTCNQKRTSCTCFMQSRCTVRVCRLCCDRCDRRYALQQIDIDCGLELLREACIMMEAVGEPNLHGLIRKAWLINAMEHLSKWRCRHTDVQFLYIYNVCLATERFFKLSIF